jgi:hypothetical protein
MSEEIEGAASFALVGAELSAYGRFREALARVPEASVKVVERLQGQATAYVWGFQDAGGDKDTGVSIEFGYAFGVVAAKYEWPSGGIGSRPNIQDAWQSWREHGEIRDWFTGRRLDGMDTEAPPMSCGECGAASGEPCRVPGCQGEWDA